MNDGKWELVDAGATDLDELSAQVWAGYAKSAWFEMNAVFVRSEVRERMAIARFEGVEVDRHVGGTVLGLMSWLGGIAKGEKHHLNEEPHSDYADARRAAALAASGAGRYEEALEGYVWLWENALTHTSVRHSFYASEIEEIVEAYAPARAVIEALRDRVAPREGELLFDTDGLLEWIALNRALGEAARSLAWFDAHPRVYSWSIEHVRLGMLERADRWRDAGLRYDPAFVLDSIARNRTKIADRVARLVRALRAADRNAEADAAEARGRELIPAEIPAEMPA